jgi:hypothetical protein
MHWIAPYQNDDQAAVLDKHLLAAAELFRDNSGLTTQEYPAPILRRIFLRFADQLAKLEMAGGSTRRGSHVNEPLSAIRRRAAPGIRSIREFVR